MLDIDDDEPAMARAERPAARPLMPSFGAPSRPMVNVTAASG